MQQGIRVNSNYRCSSQAVFRSFFHQQLLLLASILRALASLTSVWTSVTDREAARSRLANDRFRVPVMLCAARFQQFATRAGQAARFACAGLLAVAPRSLAANDAAQPDDSARLLSDLFADAAKRQVATVLIGVDRCRVCLLYTSPSPRD